MSGILQLDYYYGIEAEQFSFYRVPRLLIKDERFKKLSSDAKLLYGLMLDRMSLSMKNEWFDEDNRAYIIYTIDSIMEDLGCGKERKKDTMDVMDDVQTYIELIKENISYDHHMQYDGYGKRELYDELFQVICEVVCVKRPTIRVAGEEYPYELVKSRFLKLESSHLEYVIGCMQNTTTKITNIKAYMVTALYNAPTTINHFYQQEVQHDMYGGGWHEKGIV